MLNCSPDGENIFSRHLSTFWTRHHNEKLQESPSFMQVFLLFSQLPQKSLFKCTPLLQQFLWRFKVVPFARKTAGRVRWINRTLFISPMSPSAFKGRTFLHAETENGGLRLPSWANGQIKLLHFAQKWAFKPTHWESYTLKNTLKQ